MVPRPEVGLGVARVMGHPLIHPDSNLDPAARSLAIRAPLAMPLGIDSSDIRLTARLPMRLAIAYAIKSTPAPMQKLPIKAASVVLRVLEHP